MSKKLLSVFLAMWMVFSCCSAACIAFAEAPEALESTANVTAPAPVGAAAEKDPVVETNETVSNLLEAYIALAEKENALSAEQKATLARAEAAIQAFGSSFSANFSSEDASAQAQEILSTLSATAGKVLSAGSGAVGTFETLVSNYTGSVSTASPTEEDLAGYAQIVSAYQALTDAQKGNVDLLIFDKSFRLVLMREYYLEKAKPENAKATAKVLYATAQKNAESILGQAGWVSAFAGAKTLAETLASKTKSAQEKLSAFVAATEGERAYAGVYYASYGMFYYALDSSSAGKALVQVIQALEADALAAAPFTETAPASVSSPSVSKYPLGKDDPAYIADYAKYVEYTKQRADYNARKANYTAAFDLEAFQKIANAAPEYQSVYAFITDALAACHAFETDRSNLTAAKSAVAAYEKLSDYLKVFVQKNTTLRYYTYSTKGSSTWSTAAWTAAKLYTQCTSIAQYDLALDFIDLVEKIEPPYDNDDILAVRTAYDAMPQALRIYISEETMHKYADILASIAPDRPALDKPDLAIFEKTAVSYPSGVTRAQLEKALPGLESLLIDTLLPQLGLTGGLAQMIQTGVYTNYTVAEIAKLLYPLLGGLSSLVAQEPEDLKKALTEEKFAGACAALETAQVTGQAAYDAAVASGETDADKMEYLWNALVVQDGDFGFIDGDKEGFLDAVSVLFRPLSLLTMVLTFENTSNPTNGTYTYGAYEQLVPIFEVLDAEGYLSSVEYTAYVLENNKSMESRIRPILVPVFNLIDTFGEKPLDTLLNLLPKLGWAVKTDMLTERIGNILSSMKLVSIEPPALDAEALYDILAPMLADLSIGDTTLSISLSKAKFVRFINDVGGCGTAVVKDSVARGTAYRLGVEPDQPDAFVVLFRWLYSELTTANNIRAFKQAVDASDLGTVPQLLIKGALSAISNVSADAALTAVVNLLAPGSIQTPDINVPDISDLFGGNEDAQAPGDAATEQTQDPGIPPTGGKPAMALFSLLAVGALTAGAIRLKKKEPSDDVQ